MNKRVETAMMALLTQRATERGVSLSDALDERAIALLNLAETFDRLMYQADEAAGYLARELGRFSSSLKEGRCPSSNPLATSSAADLAAHIAQIDSLRSSMASALVIAGIPHNQRLMIIRAMRGEA